MTKVKEKKPLREYIHGYKRAEDGYLIGVDPGDKRSAVCMITCQDLSVVHSEIHPNEDLRSVFRDFDLTYSGQIRAAGIECIASYGMAVGQTVFETAEWSGRIREMLIPPDDYPEFPVLRVYRREVKLHLCKHPQAGDSNVRAALIDKYPPTGGGSNPQVGIKSNPGPLYGLAKDQWAALGVALTTLEVPDLPEWE